MKDSLYTILKLIFTISTILFMLIGFFMVCGQTVSIFSQNANTVLWFQKSLKNYSIYLSCIAGFAGFFASYVKPKKKSSC